LIPATIQAQTERLALQVDRFTGAATLRNPSGNSASIEILSYTLNSPANTLTTTDARWQSFQDASKPGWFEANPTTSNLSELASAAALSMTLGATHDFFKPFDPNTIAPLRTDRVNLTGASFKYQIPDGSLVSADIETVGRFNDLVLVVDPTTGAATLQNQSAQSIEFISYTIHSGLGSLLPGYAGSGRPGWFTANPTASDLSELASGNSIVLGEGGEVGLGLAWSIGGAEDLTLNYQAPSGVLIPGTVFFGAKAVIGLSGDHNGDGKVDAADYVVWRKNPGAFPDGYNLWRANFGNPPGAGSGSSLGGSPVPEPSTLLLSSLMLTGCAMMRRQNRD
jgi:hypothetical protein